jgi:uncharacterized membrane protein
LKDSVPESKRTEILEIVRVAVEKRSSTYFSGPHPPPELLAQYEQICPGWAVRLLEMGEREQLHRIECDREALSLDREELRQSHAWIDYHRTGQVFGFLAFLLVAGMGAYALNLGKDAIAAVCFGAFGLGIVGLFLKGRSQVATEKPDTD